MSNDTATTATTVAQKRRGRPVDPTSALARARGVFLGLPNGSTRKQTIAKFQELGISKDTSAAYYSVIKRSTRK